MLQKVFKTQGKLLAGTTVKTTILTLVMLCSGCSHETQVTPAPLVVANAVQQEELLKIKRAILDLDYAQVNALSSKVDMNQPLPDESSLLAWAIETQDPKLISLLLQQGAKANLTHGNHFSPIIQACRYGNEEIINALLDRGADPNSTINDGTSVLMLCAASTSPDMLSRLISQRTPVNAENQHGQTALMFAANAGKSENMRYLLINGAEINKQTQEGYSPLFFAIKSQDLEAVYTALLFEADLSATAKDGTTAAQLGVYTKNYAFLTMLVTELDSWLSPDAAKSVLAGFDRDGNQLLHVAVQANQPELVAALLKAGADPTTISQPSTLTWRYEANFKSENYIPPQRTPVEIAEQNKLTDIALMLRGKSDKSGA
ncbi:ankyrin repeat domain-containing protein [Alteromonas lipolytica]|uniref:Uncharacterized protein n=1 Tax=Alteromonas lipolytica TaxID=1856405 RepID=A0A1E8FK84_9ALTE|nr:ankyrin repeat domain-containing protein [Alteromonas lipolytica]OFI36332.1 hypothetical protein BFC17_00185 [Alteromonas lipolytica]GGF70754.1 hypothetical protein GCM10011338_23650 [Alteromonas lipolytica]